MSPFTSWSFHLLCLLLVIADFSVLARRGGGFSGGSGDGGSGGDNSSSGGGDGGGDDGNGSAANETCRREARYTSPLWLHRWVGTYYNGTIDVSLTIDSSNTSCSSQSAAVNETMNGVLSILEPSYSGAETSDVSMLAENPFIFILYGWPTTATQADLLGPRYYPSYLPPIVKLSLESLAMFRELEIGRLPSANVTRSNLPTCEVGNITNTDSGYSFTCQYGIEPRTFEDPSQFSVPLSACNDSRTYPFTAQNDGSTLLRGTFNPDSADFSWDGSFIGAFQPYAIKSGFPFNTAREEPDEYQYGNFTVRFRGSVDAEHSHEMVVSSNRNVSWVEDAEKEEAATFCSASLAVNLRVETWLMYLLLGSSGFIWLC
ncbi:hypothetical protein BGZ61DRAFT_539544 [Ilyonectria robusta]|uniref:uncharacterized protein n=1 Tax=Ilyonectria robusta TaxID=1079257 RepID=UPI001E8CE2E5|nr:uncharacterized protein BGZ61DRAFT_539544 [Ilyonectria robusta]KAH8661721.1 hypothetical protein BGZ61DRAFT_539544 [Ilyonectria robusta]